MISLKKILLAILLFVLIGEIILRFDEAYSPLEENRIVKISTDIELTPEYQMLINNTLVLDSSNLRIMVLGDSYIHGGGINFDENFSQQLKNNYENNNREQNIWVLDISKSSSNTLDNYITYFQFADKYKPDIVILGYNLNDVEGRLEKNNRDSLNLKEFKNKKVEAVSSVSNIKKIYNFLQLSKVLHFVLKKSHRTLNDYGVIFPNSKFDQLMKAYYQDRDNWKKSKMLLDEIIQHGEKNKIQLVFYQFADLSKFPELFDKANHTIREYFEKHENIIFLSGNDHFDNSKAMDYRISKHDGHPNEKAHKIMADYVYEVLNK